jgi:hypothetical protein
MGFFRDYTYSTTKVTAICTDTTNGNFLWVAFSQNSSGNCLLLKVSATDLNQVYYTVQVPVTCINSMVITNGYLFVAVTHSTYFAFAYSLSAPLTTFLTQFKPTGVTESPVAVATDSSGDAYFLTPGNAAGQYATVVVMNNTFTVLEVLVMNQEGVYVNNAVSLTVDSNTNVWVVTKNSPSYLVRIWLATGGWMYQQSNLI